MVNTATTSAGWSGRRGNGQPKRLTTSPPPFPVTPVALGCLSILAVFGWGPNLILCALSVAVLFAGSWICWRPGEPAVVLYLFGFQWLQASIAIFMANLAGLPVDQMAQLSSSKMATASVLTLIGLLIIFSMFRITAGAPTQIWNIRAAAQAKYLTVGKLTIVYLASLFLGIVVMYGSTLTEGLRQPLLALLAFKDAVFLIIAYVAFKRGGQFRVLFAVVFVFEFLSSLGGYFSSFQTVFTYTFIAIFASGVRIGVLQALGGGVLAAIAVFLGVVWSAVKVEYRAYLNGGTGQQVVSVGLQDALMTLADLSFSVDGDQLADGADQLMRRLSYVEFFGASLNNVPAVIEHTDGALWGNAVIHPFTPRLLFPDKAITDSSAQTNKYTGVRVAGWEQGTQISIGYMGESYIDFGRWGMFVPLGLYGLAMGFLYRKVLALRKFSGLLSMGLCVPMLMGGSYLNAETIKMVGHLTITALAIFAVHAVAGQKIQAFLMNGRRVSDLRSPASQALAQHRPASRR